MFTIFEESEVFETDIYNRSIFSICVISYKDIDDYALNGLGMIEGNFDFVCCSKNSKKSSEKLLKWWNESEIKTLEFAQHCRFWIDKNIENLPPFVSNQIISS